MWNKLGEIQRYKRRRHHRKFRNGSSKKIKKLKQVIFLSIQRLNRISEQIKKEISSIIMSEIKDPRISEMSSVIHVKVTPDLKYAKVYVSVFGNEEEKIKSLNGLKSASGFIRKKLGERMKLRILPEIHFEIDESIEHGARINQILKEIKKEEESHN